METFISGWDLCLYFRLKGFYLFIEGIDTCTFLYKMQLQIYLFTCNRVTNIYVFSAKRRRCCIWTFGNTSRAYHSAIKISGENTATYLRIAPTQVTSLYTNPWQQIWCLPILKENNNGSDVIHFLFLFFYH